MNLDFVAKAALCAAGVACVAVGSASAGVVWSGSSGSKAASADFSAAAGKLTIVLSNDSTADAGVPTDILTGIFFDIAGSPLSLARISVTVPAGNGVFISNTGAAGPVDPGNVVGGEWGYKGGLSGAPQSAKYGVSSSGLGLFGSGELFPGSNLQGPSSPDGLQYGITSAGDNIMTGNGGLSGQALIKHKIVIVLDGVGANFDLASIGNVSFQYGTDLSEPNIPGTPSPGAIALAGAACVVAGRRRR